MTIGSCSLDLRAPSFDCCKSISKSTQWQTGAFAALAVAGAIITLFGAIYGQSGSLSFYATVISGPIALVIGIGGAIWVNRCPALCTFGDVSKLTLKKSYLQHGHQALTFARQEIEKDPYIVRKTYVWVDEELQSVNEDIGKLIDLYERKEKILRSLLKHYADNIPWSQHKVLMAADAWLKTGFALSCLILEDLPAFTKLPENKQRGRSYLQLLTEKDSLQYHSYYYCIWAYHTIRKGLEYDPTSVSGYSAPMEGNKEHAKTFYRENTIQYNLRMLYNEYCDIIRKQIGEDELALEDSPHQEWIRKDLALDDYKYVLLSQAGNLI